MSTKSPDGEAAARRNAIRNPGNRRDPNADHERYQSVDINSSGPTPTVFGADQDDVQARTIEQASAKARARIAFSKALHGDDYS